MYIVQIKKNSMKNYKRLSYMPVTHGVAGSSPVQTAN